MFLQLLDIVVGHLILNWAFEIAYKKQMDNGTTLKVHPIWFEFQVPFQPLCKGYVSPDAAASGDGGGRLDLRAYSRRHPGIA